MDTVQRYTSGFGVGFQRFAVLAWYWLRSPRTTAAFALILALVLLLRLLLPQQSSLEETAGDWSATLPVWLRPWGDLIFFVGFSRIFDSIWFWGCLAVLVLSSLVGLVDYGRFSRRRAGQEAAEIEWQHPLARRVEQSVRLPPNPNLFLDKLKERLKAEGFQLDEPVEENERFIRASRWRWAWWGVISCYAGLVLLGPAFLISYYFLETESLTLSPFEAQPSDLFNGSLELDKMEISRGLGTITYRQNPTGIEQVVTWRLYLPAFFGNAVVLPVAAKPVFMIEARDASGELRRLVPIQVDLPPATRLSLPLGEAEAPLYFLIPSAGLDFQILPVSGLAEDSYNVQVRRKRDTTPSENFMMKLGETFEVDGLSVTVVGDYNMTLVARRDPALPLYGISLAAIGAGLLAVLLRPPWHVWLIPEVKGRGGQLYGVVEQFGPAKEASRFLDQLLSSDESLVIGH